jgi:predicted RND superfamily exporter protein
VFGIGVAFQIYQVMAWRAGKTNFLTSSLARAVLFSGLTTGVAFGALIISSHPGTASMGRLLLISLAFTLATALFFGPALMGPPPAAKDCAPEPTV